MSEIVWATAQDIPARVLYPGIRSRQLWQGESGAKALLVEIDPGSSWQEVDVHEPGPEEVYVVSGIFNDGIRDYAEGTFLHCPAGSSHIPQSKTGCTLLVLFPEG